MDLDDDHLTTPRPKLGPDEKYAVYHKDQGWLVDTGVGGTWSWNVDDAQWFDGADAAVESLYACDIIEYAHEPLRSATEQPNWVEAGFVIPRVR